MYEKVLRCVTHAQGMCLGRFVNGKLEEGERPKCIIYEIFECGMPHSNLSYTGIPVCSGTRYNDPRL